MCSPAWLALTMYSVKLDSNPQISHHYQSGDFAERRNYELCDSSISAWSSMLLNTLTVHLIFISLSLYMFQQLLMNVSPELDILNKINWILKNP